jgi:hypothetical protein
MSNRPIPDPVEATFRDLRGALYTGDGLAAMAAIKRRPDLDTLQYFGDGLRLALAQGVTDAALRAADVPDELARFHRFTDDRRRGRARQWLAESGLRPAVPAQPASPGRPDLRAVP